MTNCAMNEINRKENRTMTKYGIHFPKIDTDPSNSLALARDVGFNGIMVNFNGIYPPEMIVNSARSNNLEIYNLHMTPFYRSGDLWKKGDEGELFVSQMINSLEIASRYEIPAIVVHASDKRDPLGEPNELGLERYIKLLKLAEQLGVKIALENTYSLPHIYYIFDNIESPWLVFCYDSGHENCLTHTKECLPRLRNRLGALHLHDNDGTKDQHLIPFTVSENHVDWDYVMKNLDGYEGPITLESEYSHLTSENPKELFKASIEAVRKIKNS